MREGHNEAKHVRALIGYWDSNGNFIPLSVVHHLPADTNFSNVLTISAVQVSPIGAFELPNRFASLTTVEDYIRMFDGKLDTYATWHFYNGSAGSTDSVYIWFGGESFIINEILMYYDIEKGDVSNLSFIATDVNGNTYNLTASTSTLNILNITRNVLTLTGFPNSNIIQIEVKHANGANMYTKLLVRELRVYLKQVTRGNMGVDINGCEITLPTGVFDTENTRINPATEEMQSEIRDQLLVLKDALKPTRTAPIQELSSKSIIGGGTAEFVVVNTETDGFSALAVTVKATYDASATAGVRVRWLYSPDGINFDSIEDAEASGNYEDLSFDAGATRIKTILVPIFMPYVKVQVVNLDISARATVDAWRTLMR